MTSKNSANEWVFLIILVVSQVTGIGIGLVNFGFVIPLVNELWVQYTTREIEVLDTIALVASSLGPLQATIREVVQLILWPVLPWIWICTSTGMNMNRLAFTHMWVWDRFIVFIRTWVNSWLLVLLLDWPLIEELKIIAFVWMIQTIAWLLGQIFMPNKQP